MQKYSTHNSMWQARRGADFDVIFPQHPGAQGRPSTPNPSRKVSFDNCVNIEDDIDVTSRFLTSHYTTCCIQHESPRPSFPCVSNRSRETKKPPAKRGMSSKHTLTRLSRSGCLRQLDEESTRSFKGRAIPSISVSEDDMTLALESASDSAMGVPRLDESSTSTSSSPDQEYEEDDAPLGYGWGQFVEILRSDLERGKQLNGKKVTRTSYKRSCASRYCPYPIVKSSSHSSTNDISEAMNNILL
eukprot:scaffold2719_cov266-Chaetoceros_neogracile.AAC.3